MMMVMMLMMLMMIICFYQCSVLANTTGLSSQWRLSVHPLTFPFTLFGSQLIILVFIAHLCPAFLKGGWGWWGLSNNYLIGLSPFMDLWSCIKKLVLYQIMIQFLMKSPHFWKSELWAPVQLFHTRPLAPVSVIGAPLQQLPSWLLTNHNMIHYFTFAF